MRVAIVGGGIGGMALALSLCDAGIEDVEVYESTSTVKELGVGINVLPHAVCELTELGLLDDLYRIGIPTAELVYYSRHGQRIWGEPRGLAAGYRWPQLSVHRGEFLGVLYRVVLERLGPERVHTLATTSSGSGRRRAAQSGASSSTGPPTRPSVVSRSTCSWRATVSTPWSAGRSTRTRDRPGGTASPCGVRSRSVSRFSPAAR